MSAYWNEVQIDYLNIGLILLSLVLAFVLPFELFLFSYAVLGPLHYLTEIPWLHSREYFVKKKSWVPLAYVSVCFIGTLAIMWPHPSMDHLARVLVPLLFLGALVLVVAKGKRAHLIGAALVAAICAWILFAQIDVVLFTLFIPTVIHVFVFTAFFMLYGAMKRGRKSGYLSVSALLFAAVAVLAFGQYGDLREVSSAVTGPMHSFVHLNSALIALFNSLTFTEWTGTVTEAVYESSAGLLVMRFLAFAYTYHYLNWFTKTSIIGWHKVARWKLAIILLIWVASVAIYVVDYNLGIRVLFLLSFLHVLLEFPLNHISFMGVGKGVLDRLGFGTPIKK